MRALLTLATVAALLPVAAAQVEAKPEKLPGSTSWHRIVRIAYKPGKLDAALKIIEEHFRPAADASGFPPPKAYVHVSGSWNVTLNFRLPGGLSDLGWKLSPKNAAWMNSLAKNCGGVEKAKAVMAEYMGLIVKFESDLVRTWTPAGKGN